MSKIYHYTTLQKLMEGILPNQVLLMNQYGLSNDPMENKLFWFNFQNRSNTLEEYENKRSFNTKLNAKIRNGNSKIISFSKTKRVGNKIQYGYSLPRMWAQYGDNHRGVCLVIDKNRFVKENKRNLDLKRQVKYHFEFPEPELDYSKIKDNCTDDQINTIIKEYKCQIFFTKLLDWKTEQEYRVISYSNEDKYCSIINSLDGIIMGAKLNSCFASAITTCIKSCLTSYKNEIKIYKAKFDRQIILHPFLFDCIQTREVVTIEDN